ncbi:succinylglutamate desuccinylase/aspartoacylase family protein [Sulfobacillus harzensis]|uniref:Succinylglutamate desuccinylase n=1 Tax=Sulfobacillus harzensis TaxID=2729629 RepID=A0A7Y0Q3G1_9FIRM|nr:M14 family metallopeptidase [Sulfobacillus harzensis]NMP23360.1 succinylglutamate desuccinylase [Sulfobacillus harzensis]
MVGKTRQWLEVPGTEVRLPATDIQGAGSGPTLFITAGVHGGEYTGIEASIRLATELNPEQLNGRVKIIHLSNPPAFWAKRQYVNPLDEKNLNRVFPGNAQGSVTERIADVVIAEARTADFWADLHSGDIHEALLPFTLFSDQGSLRVAQQAERLARAYGIDHILRSTSIAGGSYAAAAELGIPAITAESGQLGRMSDADVAVHLRGPKSLLKHLDMLPGMKPPLLTAPVLTQFAWISSPASGLYYSDLAAGQRVSAGQLAGLIRDIFGHRVAEVLVPQDGIILFTVASLAINQGDPLFAVAAP